MARGIVVKAGDIFRDIGSMIGALDVRGGGGSPKELRSDAGVFVHYDLDEELSRHFDLLTRETVLTSRTFLINATATSTFSFPEDHYILDLTAFLTVTPANLEWVSLTSNDQASTVTQLLLFGELGDQRTLVAGTVNIGGAAALSIMVPPFLTELPRFAPANTDYTLQVRGSGLGGGTLRLATTVTRCPKGVPIPH